MTEPKLCKDCRWALNLVPDQKAPPAMYYQCHHPSSAITLPPDLVTGAPAKAEWEFCSHARDGLHSGHCGPEGRFWEPLEVGFGEMV